MSIFLSALDLTAVSTALPTITKKLNGGSDFSWVGSAYALASTAVLPLSGKLADVFGRKPVILASIVFFAIGSALAGAAQNMNMLIAARILNLPLTAIAFTLVTLFLRVRTPEGSIREKLARVDWIGNLTVIAGTTVAIVGLTWAGIQHPWDSAAVLAPSIIGLALIAGFLFAGTIFPVLAPLSVERIAAALAFFAFVRAFAQTWGITIASTILQNELKKKLPIEFASQFQGGFQIAYAAIPLISGLEEPLRSQVRAAFADMSIIWKTMIGISGLGLLTVPFLKEVPMHSETHDKFGLHEEHALEDLKEAERA
ncbi:hypothetical protein EWM64_g7440 [Hericium alpestre]|uniref:Major facilitator superfamily (MFS) profile domain-containing protein n=1 Tax=Hericium alpestre TaxID=135208 RepID=A0A4Y9ZP79_9AGAM|nr:hypothetical protein EWM64_g7440 [Hericium alpestre]